jgi:uncharacterized protein
MTSLSHTVTDSRKAAAARVAAAFRTEVGLARLALGAVALHVLDDNYLQPEPGTSLGDHLASGLVPIAVLMAVAAIYARLRAGFRAALAMSFGAIGITFGVPGTYYLVVGHASGDDYTGPLAIVAGTVLVALGPVTLSRNRRTNESRWRRSLTGVGGLVVAAVIVVFFVFPVGFSYVYTHTGRTATTPNLGVPFETVQVTTSDSLELTGWYVPSKNRAAVVVFPGATRAEEARMLIRHGYGVLVLEARGQGTSEGDIVRWAGDRDLLAGAEYLRNRTDVDPDRIGAMGFSIGGEILLEAAAQSPAFKAIVSEGAGERVGDADVEGAERLVSAPMMAVMTAATTVFSNHGPPPAIVDRIGRIAPRPVFLIYADPGMGGENTRQPKYYAAAGEPKTIWKVPDSGHTGGIDAQPAEYERRVIAFFDAALLGSE